MNATAVQSEPAQLNVLGRYTVPDEARVLVGRRIENEVYVYDYPKASEGRRYFVEKGFESKAELAVLIADYLRRAQRLGACAISPSATQVRQRGRRASAPWAGLSVASISPAETRQGSSRRVPR